jgi:hypothetical protein
MLHQLKPFVWDFSLLQTKFGAKCSELMTKIRIKDSLYSKVLPKRFNKAFKAFNH